MRAAYNSKEWLLDDAGNFMGISLGFDFCSQHESATAELHTRFGVNLPTYPIGVHDRKITACPESLSFVEYSHVPKDKRRKPVKAASVILRSYDNGRIVDHQELLRALDLGFLSDIGERWHTSKNDVVCAWSRDDFGINVRGHDNIEKLRRLYAAFQSMDIALCCPTAQGFIRQGLAFVICSAVPASVHESVNAADLAHKRLYSAAEESGIESLLDSAGLGAHGLSPDWYDRDKEEGLIFFLNPWDQRRYQHGWYSLEELKLWAQGQGPVLRDEALEVFGKAHPDWEVHLIRGLEKEGLALRYHARLAWMDSAKTKVGIRIRPAGSCLDRLPEGIYSFDEWMTKYIPAEASAEIA